MSTCCKYTAGMLKTPVEFQEPTRTGDGAGGYTTGWAAKANTPTRAYVTALSGRERYASQRVEATVALKVVVRYFTGLEDKDAVMIDGKRCNIGFINNLEFEDKWLEISVTQGVAP